MEWLQCQLSELNENPWLEHPISGTNNEQASYPKSIDSYLRPSISVRAVVVELSAKNGFGGFCKGGLVGRNFDRSLVNLMGIRTLSVWGAVHFMPTSGD